jgi:hypothetical protein
MSHADCALAGGLAIPICDQTPDNHILRGNSLKFRSILLPKLVRDELALQRLIGLARRRASALLPTLSRTGPATAPDDADPKAGPRYVE